MKPTQHPALQFFRARSIDELIEAHRLTNDWPILQQAAIWDFAANAPQKGGLHDPALFPDAHQSGAVIDLPLPVVHPLVLREIAEALNIDPDRLRRLGTGDLSLEDGQLVQYPVDHDKATSGPQALIELATRAFSGRQIDAKTLFTTRLPILPLAQRPMTSSFARSAFDHEYGWAISRATLLRHLLKINYPELTVYDEWDLLQGNLENLIALLEGRELVSPRWIDTDPRHLAGFLRRDRGEGKSDEELWDWASAPKPPNGVAELQFYGHHPWAPDRAFVLGLLLVERALVIILRHGISVCSLEGTALQWHKVGPLRPFATDGRHVAMLSAHPRGGYVPEITVLDTDSGQLLDNYPSTLPTYVVSGHWGAKSLVIFDRKGRRERLLRRDKGDDYNHHFSSPDGSYTWLAEYPREGILQVSDGTPAFDLAAIGLGTAEGVFYRAFVKRPDGAFRIYARGRFYHDGALIWSDNRSLSAAFNLNGDTLATTDGTTVSLRRLDHTGSVSSESKFALPMTRKDFHLPKAMQTDDILSDILFASVGPLDRIAATPIEDIEPHLVEQRTGWLSLRDDQKPEPAEIQAWLRQVHEFAQSRRHPKKRRKRAAR